MVEWHKPFLGDEDHVDSDIWYEIYWITEGFLPNEKIKSGSCCISNFENIENNFLTDLLTDSCRK